MRVLKKVLLLLSLLSLASSVLAEEVKENSEEMITLAREKMNLAIVETGKTIEGCMDKEKNTTLSSQVFPKLPLSDNEWRIVVGYLYFRAVDRCEGAAHASALLAVSHYKYIVKKITGKRLAEFLASGSDQVPKGEDQGDVAELFYGEVERYLKYEVKYRKIDSKIRQVLEGIPELNKPFNPLAASEVLGLSPH